ncbi:MAG: hypothetical protein OEY33_03155 [Bdellovibrionales bacterium]|jgi:hypothetical protein|nr:hypothetical protein [Bdellovibrionales bacterium]
MALNLEDINKQKKTFTKKKSDSGVDTINKKRPWKDFEREEDLLDLISKRPSPKKTIAKDFKKNEMTDKDKQKKVKKQQELEENKKRGISSELKLKLKKVSKDYFSDLD